MGQTAPESRPIGFGLRACRCQSLDICRRQGEGSTVGFLSKMDRSIKSEC